MRIALAFASLLCLFLMGCSSFEEKVPAIRRGVSLLAVGTATVQATTQTLAADPAYQDPEAQEVLQKIQAATAALREALFGLQRALIELEPLWREREGIPTAPPDEPDPDPPDPSEPAVSGVASSKRNF